MGAALVRRKRSSSAARVDWVAASNSIQGSWTFWPTRAYNRGKPLLERPLLAFQSRKQEKCTIVLECSSHGLNDSMHPLDQSGSDAGFQSHVILLRSCSTAKALPDGKRVHQRICERGLEHSMVLGSLLVQLYGECRALEDACATFANMRRRTVFAWNIMIKAYGLHGQGELALCLFVRMRQEGIIPDKITFISVLSVCASEAALAEGKWIHTLVIDSPFMACTILRNALVNMYCKCAAVQEAHREFDNINQRNTISWTVMITSYAQNGLAEQAFQLFQQMQQEGTLPDKVTFVSVLHACASVVAVIEGKQMHVRVTSGGLESDSVVGTALINMYGKCGLLKEARGLFDRIQEQSVVAWTAMIEAYAHNELGKDALQLFDRMQWEGFVPNKVTIVSILGAIGSQEALVQGKHVHAMIVGSEFELDALVYTTLINMYGKCHSLKNARTVFNKIHDGDVVKWSAMIAVYVQNGEATECFQLYYVMLQEGVRPNKVTFVSVLDACASHAALGEGKQIHVCVLESGFKSDIVIGNALVHMYGKCGNLCDAQRMFDSMQERDIVSWNTLIAVYAQHGQGKAALHIFHQMGQKGVPPDRVTFLNILSACSHTGLVDEGFRCFVSMNKDHDIAPVVRHYNCMIDLLGRAGQLDEAEDLVDNMQLQPSLVSLTALLGACRYRVDASRGERVAMRAFVLDPENVSVYLMLSRIYSAAGRGDDVVKKASYFSPKKQAGLLK